jgi:putative nucleotidyltransferase with HDIG domain
MAATLMERTADPVRPASTVRQTVLNDLDRVDTYPTLSDTAIRVVGMADRSDVSVAEVAAVVRRDGVLAARILRVANSCAFRGRGVIEDVQQGVLRIGLQECTRILCAMGLRSVYEGHPPAVRARCDALLRHSLFVGRLASGLARIGAVVPPAVAFTAGLLHDIGRVILCVKCDGTIAAPPSTRETDETPAAERAVYGIDHCAIGYQFATRNNLPETVVRAALNHHRPEEEQFQRPLVALVAFAERVSNHVQWHHNVAGYDLDACPRFEVLSDNWGAKRAGALRAGLADAAVQAIRDTRRMLKSCA